MWTSTPISTRRLGQLLVHSTGEDNCVSGTRGQNNPPAQPAKNGTHTGELPGSSPSEFWIGENQSDPLLEALRIPWPENIQKEVTSAYTATLGRLTGADGNRPKTEIKNKTANHQTTRISAGG